MKAIVCFATFLNGFLLGQAFAQELTNAGKPVVGIHLLASLKTNVIAVGSTVTLFQTMTNSSTNLIYTHQSDRALDDSSISLIDKGGSVFDFKVRENTNEMVRTIRINLFLPIEPREARQFEIPITLDQRIKPGIYTLRISRRFHEATAPKAGLGPSHVVTANLVNLEVK